MKTYTVRAVWEDGDWALSVDEVPGVFSQCKRLDQVETNIAEAIELMTGERLGEDYTLRRKWRAMSSEDFDVVDRVHALREQAAKVTAQAEQSTNEAVRRLRDEGFTYRDIGTMVGISHSRAQQLVSS